MDAREDQIELTGSLLLIIPGVVTVSDEGILVDGDFGNNLKGYLARFKNVTVMCPPSQSAYMFPSVIKPDTLPGSDRLRIILLPIPYREDRYLLKRRSVIRQLDSELHKADCVLLSPHAAFDWSILAADRCIRMGKPYNMEADWDTPAVWRFMLKNMSPGFKRIRKGLSYWYFDRQYRRALQNSTISLLQGGDVYEGLAPLARRPFMVLNVQVAKEEHITPANLAAKTRRVESNGKPLIVYTGRADEIKGPLQWINTIAHLQSAGCDFEAIWAGDGPLLSKMHDLVEERGLSDRCKLIGKVSRHDARALIERADIFLYCHMTKESPRCLVEALALGSPILGFGSKYSEGLVASKGGGLFVDVGDHVSLAKNVADLISDRKTLSRLIRQAAASGELLERDAAINERINLMKSHLMHNQSADELGSGAR